MRSPAAISRICGGLALMFALMATMFAVPSATAQTGNSSIEVHNRVCPVEYEGENFFDDCHDTPAEPGLAFTFTDGVTREGTLDQEGNVGFANLPAGTYTITGGAPDEFADYYVYCAVGTEGNPNQEQIPVNYVTGGIQFDLPADTNVICDWYEIPYDLQGDDPAPTAAPVEGESSIEVHARVCPTDYQGTNYFDDCHANPLDPGYTFAFTNQDTGEVYEGETNENGNVGFANLSEGTYNIAGGPPGDVTNTFVYCAAGVGGEAGQEEIASDDVNGGINFYLPADTNVVCDWYAVPQSQQGETPTPVEGESSIEVHNRICPTGYEGENWFEDCHSNVPDPGLPFTFADGVTREGTTNENGNVGFANLPAGTYTITGGAPGDVTDYLVYCSTESTGEQIPVDYVSGGVQLELPVDTNLVCDWYTIPLSQNGQTPAPTEAPTDGDASIEVHNRVCPEGYEGDEWFDDCHDNAPDPGLPFTFTDGVTREGTTNENGNVGFANLPAGTYTITGGAPGEFSDYVVYCSSESTQEQIPVEYVTGGVQFELPANTNVVCDWYTIPLSQNGQPTATQPSADTFDLPIYKLLCDEAPAEQAMSDFVNLGSVPAGCEQYAGTTVTVTDGAGTELGTCVTESAEPCYVTVEVGSVVYGTEDLTTVPEGYTPLNGETMEVSIEPATEASMLFVNVATQPEPDTFDLPIYKLLCEQDPGGTAGTDFVLEGTVPEGCEQFEGVPVTVTDVNGAEIGTCVTGATEPCYVTVEVGSTVYATEDLSAVPEGYAPVDGETIEYTIEPATEAWILFVNVNVQEDPTPTTADPTPTVAPTPTPTTEPLPEGRTLHIATGTCEVGADRTVVVELDDLRGPDGEPVGLMEAITAETSTTTIGLTLDDLVNNDHVVVAFSEDDVEAAGDPVACAPIGGVVNDSGELVIGMLEHDDSGYAGIVYMAPEDDASQTGVTVFLAEGLAEDDAQSTPGA